MFAGPAGSRVRYNGETSNIGFQNPVPEGTEGIALELTRDFDDPFWDMLWLVKLDDREEPVGFRGHQLDLVEGATGDGA